MPLSFTRGIIIMLVLIVICVIILNTVRGVDIKSLFQAELPEDEGFVGPGGGGTSGESLPPGVVDQLSELTTVYKSDVGCAIASYIYDDKLRYKVEDDDQNGKGLREQTPGPFGINDDLGWYGWCFERGGDKELCLVSPVKKLVSLPAGTTIQLEPDICSSCSYLDEACINMQLKKRVPVTGSTFCGEWWLGDTQLKFGNDNVYPVNEWCSHDTNDDPCGCISGGEDDIQYWVVDRGYYDGPNNNQRWFYNEDLKDGVDALAGNFYFFSVYLDVDGHDEYGIEFAKDLQGGQSTTFESADQLVDKLFYPVIRAQNGNYVRKNFGGLFQQKLRRITSIDFTVAVDVSQSAFKTKLWNMATKSCSYCEDWDFQYSQCESGVCGENCLPSSVRCVKVGLSDYYGDSGYMLRQGNLPIKYDFDFEQEGFIAGQTYHILINKYQYTGDNSDCFDFSIVISKGQECQESISEIGEEDENGFVNP